MPDHWSSCCLLFQKSNFVLHRFENNWTNRALVQASAPAWDERALLPFISLNVCVCITLKGLKYSFYKTRTYNIISWFIGNAINGNPDNALNDPASIKPSADKISNDNFRCAIVKQKNVLNQRVILEQSSPKLPSFYRFWAARYFSGPSQLFLRAYFLPPLLLINWMYWF